MTHTIGTYIDRRYFRRFVANKALEYGPKWDESHLYPQFRDFLYSDMRIRVTGPIFGTRTGTVGVTTGWAPCFLLMHRSSSRGSSDLLSPADRITHVQLKGTRRYMPIAEYERRCFDYDVCERGEDE